MTKAFEPDKPAGRVDWHSGKWTILQQLYKDINSETRHARDKFMFPGAHLEMDLHSKSYWLAVITEEVGKLCQCINKLQLASDHSIRANWQDEGYHRIITTLSLLRRLAENWSKLPDG